MDSNNRNDLLDDVLMAFTQDQGLLVNEQLLSQKAHDVFRPHQNVIFPIMIYSVSQNLHGMLMTFLFLKWKMSTGWRRCGTTT